MASWMVHLRIADELLRRLRNIDEEAFVMGNIAPDSGVPNADWSKFSPPKSETHFYRKGEHGSVIDLDAFREKYFTPAAISGYGKRAYSFFLGYYVHLLTDVRWSDTVFASLKRRYPGDWKKLIDAAKEDWYDLDFLYLAKNPDFRAFAVFENAVDFDNEYMDIFSRDAFGNRRKYICGFYRGDEHGDLYRNYIYLTPEEADSFVAETSERILNTIKDRSPL